MYLLKIQKIYFQFPIKWEYDTIAYRMAASKKELCTKTKKVPLSEEFEQHPSFKVSLKVA